MRAGLFSFFYRAIRRQVINHTYRKQLREKRPRHLEDAVDIGDCLLKCLPKWVYSFRIPDNIGITLYDLHFPSPLTLASFKSDMEIVRIWRDFGLGGVSTKGIMRYEREGNNKPRLQEVPSDSGYHLLNAMGMPGPGIELIIDDIDHSGILSAERPTGFNFGGNSLDEYKYNFDRLNVFLEDRACQYYFEVNISCPNTPEGQQFTKHPELLEDLLIHMRRKSCAVISVKVSPDLLDVDLLYFAKLVRKFPQTVLNCGNTSFRKCSQVGLPDDAISIGGGGLSGSDLYSRTLEMVRIASAVLPVIATGGIDCAEKVKEVLDAGASLVGMASAVVRDPYCIPKINYSLSKR